MLVKNMMQKEQALAGRQQERGDVGRVSSASSAISESNKERERTLEEMNRLRDAIQSLCQSTNPLARSMDYIQEDLDNMGKELDFWMKDKVAQTQKLEEEERKTEIELEALVSQLRVRTYKHPTRFSHEVDNVRRVTADCCGMVGVWCLHSELRSP